MAFTALDVKKLREMTNVGMMDCKKALQATDGDMDAAIDWLREKGLAKAAKKAGRIAAEGVALATVVDGVVTAVGKGQATITDSLRKAIRAYSYFHHINESSGLLDIAKAEALVLLPLQKCFVILNSQLKKLAKLNFVTGTSGLENSIQNFHQDDTISIDLHVMVGDGVNLKTIGKEIIDEVRYMVTQCTGTEGRAVNVYIDSITIG